MKQKTRIIIYIAIAVTALALGIIAVLSAPKSNTIETADEFMELGNKYLIELSYDKAVIEFNKAIEIEPRNADAYIGLAEAYLGMGDEEKAVETLELGYENTGDERIREMLDELLGEDEVTISATETVVEENKLEDSIEITDIVCTGWDEFLEAYSFEVTVKYELSSSSKGVIVVPGYIKGKNESFDAIDHQIVNEGTGKITLNVMRSSRYEINKFSAYLIKYPYENSHVWLASTPIVTIDVSDIVTTIETKDNNVDEATVNLYIPNKITVFRDYNYNDNTILNYNSLSLCYDNYKFDLQLRNGSSIDDNTIVINNPPVSLYAGFDENLVLQASDSGNYLDLRYFENPKYISINAQHSIFSVYNDTDIENINHLLEVAEKSTETYADNYSSISTYNSEGYLIKRTYPNEAYEKISTYEYDSNWDLLKEISSSDYPWGKEICIMHFVYESGKLVKQYYEQDNMNIVNNCRYGYDEQGRRKSIALYRLDEMEYQLFYDYDDHGNISTISVYDSIDKLIEKVDIEYKVIKANEKSVLKCEEEFSFKFNR